MYSVGQKRSFGFFLYGVSLTEKAELTFLANPIWWFCCFWSYKSAVIFCYYSPVCNVLAFFWMLWRLISLTDVLKCGFGNHIAIISSNIFSLLRSHSSSEIQLHVSLILFNRLLKILFFQIRYYLNMWVVLGPVSTACFFSWLYVMFSCFQFSNFLIVY